MPTALPGDAVAEPNDTLVLVIVRDSRTSVKLPAVLSRTDTPVFTPETAWEKTGQVANVVFVEGMVRLGGRWLFYYGGADKYVGVAAADLP